MTSVYTRGSGTLVYNTIYTNRHSKLEKSKNREAEKSKKNRERKSEESRRKKLKQVGRLQLTKWKCLETWEWLATWWWVAVTTKTDDFFFLVPARFRFTGRNIQFSPVRPKHPIFADKAETVWYGSVLRAVRIKGSFGIDQFTGMKKNRPVRYRSNFLG